MACRLYDRATLGRPIPRTRPVHTQDGVDLTQVVQVVRGLEHDELGDSLSPAPIVHA
jgi:hypothetical protein